MYFWPPESISRWRWVASLLAHIKRLDVLKLDIMCSVPLEHSDYQTTTDEIVLGALKPLKDLKAKVFTVEINVQPSVKVWTRLEEVNFTLEVTERPFKTEVYGRNPRLEHTDRENWVR
jgi:hypothetical protein